MGGLKCVSQAKGVRPFIVFFSVFYSAVFESMARTSGFCFSNCTTNMLFRRTIDKFINSPQVIPLHREETKNRDTFLTV